MRSSTTLPRCILRWKAGVVLLNCLTGCGTYHGTMTESWEEATPQQALAGQEQPDRLRVILAERTWVVLRQPTIARDSLFGQVETGMYRGQWLRGGRRTGIPLESVVQMAVLKKSEYGGGVLGLLGAFGGVEVMDALAQGLVVAMWPKWPK